MKSEVSRFRYRDTIIGVCILCLFIIGVLLFSIRVASFLFLFIILNRITLLVWKKYIFGFFLSTGPSMRPILPDGLKLTIDMYPISIQEGDIVTYYCPDTGEFCQHKVIHISDDLISVQGTGDVEKVPIHRIVGKSLLVFGSLLYIPISPIAIRETIEAIVFEGEDPEA